MIVKTRNRLQHTKDSESRYRSRSVRNSIMRRALHCTAASSSTTSSNSLLRISRVSTMLFPLLLATATLASPADRGLRYSNSVDEEFITQLVMLPFSLKLEPTPYVLEGEDSLETFVQTAIEDYIASQTSGLEYVLLAGIESVDWDSGTNRNLQATPPSTTIKFNGGVASFSEPVAEDFNVNTGAMEATTLNLVTLLQGTTEFGDITSAAYISTTEAPTGAPTDEQNTVVVAPVERANKTYENQGPNTGAVVGSLLGVAFVVLASVLLIQKHNQVHSMPELDLEDKPSQEVDDDAATEVDDAELDQQQQEAIANECESQQAHYHDAASTDQGSVVSEWTLTSRDTSTGFRKNEMVVPAETFERDRHVALRKDLLLSPWTGAAVVSPQQQPSMPLTPRGRGRQDFASWRTQQGDVDSDSPFRFEQAHAAQGEEVYFMPPSRARKSRDGTGKLESV